MENFNNLYDFIDLAKINRKYPENTANNLRSALKIFEKELNADELKSVSMIASSIEEIFRGVVMANKNKSIISLNTYKARLLKVINDYKKYGIEPGKMQNWNIKIKKSTPLLIKKDKTDKGNKDISNSICATVNNIHKIELSFESGIATIVIPQDISPQEAKKIKDIIDSLI